MKKLLALILLALFAFTSCANEAEESSMPDFKYNINGKYSCQSKYCLSLEKENQPYVEFFENGECLFFVNYLGGLTEVRGTYKINGNKIYAEVNLKGSFFEGTGTQYMNSKYTFEIINNNLIVIENGYYIVEDGDVLAKETETNEPDLDSAVYSPTDDIKIEYPQFKLSGYEETNEIIKSFAENLLVIDGVENYQGVSADFKYKIELYDKNYLSFAISGLFNVITAAHSINYFKALTIDLTSKKVLKLEDFITVDKAFVSYFRKQYKNQVCQALNEKFGMPKDNKDLSYIQNSLDHFDDDTLAQMIQENPFYITENLVYVTVDLSHAVGDYLNIWVKER